MGMLISAVCFGLTLIIENFVMMVVVLSVNFACQLGMADLAGQYSELYPIMGKLLQFRNNISRKFNRIWRSIYFRLLLSSERVEFSDERKTNRIIRLLIYRRYILRQKPLFIEIKWFLKFGDSFRKMGIRDFFKLKA